MRFKVATIGSLLLKCVPDVISLSDRTLMRVSGLEDLELLANLVVSAESSLREWIFFIMSSVDAFCIGLIEVRTHKQGIDFTLLLSLVLLVGTLRRTGKFALAVDLLHLLANFCVDRNQATKNS